MWKLALLKRSCDGEADMPHGQVEAAQPSTAKKRPLEADIAHRTSDLKCRLQDARTTGDGRAAGGGPGELGNRESTAASPPSILLPAMGSVCHFGSARRMKDVQDGLCR